MDVQVLNVFENQFHAGTKAPTDCALIMNELGIELIKIIEKSDKRNIISKIKRQLDFLVQWGRLYFRLNKGDYFFLQLPIDRNQLGMYTTINLLKRKKIKLISIIHDIREIREHEFSKRKIRNFDHLLNMSEKIIAHNKAMVTWLVETKRLDRNKIISLEIFDYLTDTVSLPKNMGEEIVIAGNLSPEKSAYIYKLNDLDLKFTLFGPNFIDQKNRNLFYNGVYPPEDLPSVLKGKFGLVWDGDSIDTCSGKTGNYLKYNNPHKLSLYIVSGLPVIVWKKSAVADFVEQRRIGFCIDSLKEIPNLIENLSNEEYTEYVNNVAVLSNQLRNGHFLKQAIRKVK